VSVPTGLLYDIQQKLIATDKGAKDYWPVTAQVISYHSELLKLVASIPTKECFPEHPRTIFTAISEHKNCILDLDQTRTVAVDIICDNCIVRYSGGPTLISGVRFINCLFVLRNQENQNPDSSGQKFEETLLASDLRDVVIPSSS
jgi:hypothetical protein